MAVRGAGEPGFREFETSGTALDPALVPPVRDCFAEQTSEHWCAPRIGPDDPPAIHRNEDRMGSFREALREALEPFHHDPERHDHRLGQPGINLPHGAGERGGERESPTPPHGRDRWPGPSPGIAECGWRPSASDPPSRPGSGNAGAEAGI